MSRPVDLWRLTVTMLTGEPLPELPQLAPGQRCTRRDEMRRRLGTPSPEMLAERRERANANARLRRARQRAEARAVTITPTHQPPTTENLNMEITFEELTACIPDDTLMLYAGLAARDPDTSPAAQWIGLICSWLLAKRVGQPLPEIPPLILAGEDRINAIAFLNAGSAALTKRGIETGDEGTMELAALHRVVAERLSVDDEPGAVTH